MYFSTVSASSETVDFTTNLHQPQIEIGVTSPYNRRDPIIIIVRQSDLYLSVVNVISKDGKRGSNPIFRQVAPEKMRYFKHSQP